MSRFVYSIVRCLPDPHTGEFVNIGAVAVDPLAGRWAVRQLSDTDRIRKFVGGPALEAATSCLLALGEKSDQNQAALMEDEAEPLGEDWLAKPHRDHRNVAQFSEPATGERPSRSSRVCTRIASSITVITPNTVVAFGVDLACLFGRMR
ncbi:DUF3037 domain-containing protein [Nonomuraea sp. CA-218870]|uniref:DUF3037 domain-containing protein n=1 Tax=Nonomuraea sp. CA-218870 TaxID=3239998 RepID=UPI003D8FA90F